MDHLAEAHRYLNLIRNKPKRVYGFAYLAWIRNGCVGYEPERGPLSYMGAQAVRIQLTKLLDNRPLDFRAEGR